MNNQVQIYLAGKYTSQERLRGARADLQALGYNVVASWLDETATDANASAETMLANARRDIEEVKAADTLILDTLDESATGGREVELGVALATDMPVALPLHHITTTISLVGPKRNIFHRCAHFQYADWDECLAAAAEEQRVLGII